MENWVFEKARSQPSPPPEKEKVEEGAGAKMVVRYAAGAGADAEATLRPPTWIAIDATTAEAASREATRLNIGLPKCMACVS